MSWKFQRVLENGLLDLLWNAIWMRRLGPGDPVEKSLGAEGLEVAPDLIKLLPGITHELAGFGNVVEFRGELKQAELAPSDFLFSGHVCVWFGFWWYKTLTKTTWPLSALSASHCQAITISAHIGDDSAMGKKRFK